MEDCTLFSWKTLKTHKFDGKGDKTRNFMFFSHKTNFFGSSLSGSVWSNFMLNLPSGKRRKFAMFKGELFKIKISAKFVNN